MRTTETPLIGELGGPTAALDNEVRICQLNAEAPQQYRSAAHSFIARRLLHLWLHAARAAAWATLRWHGYRSVDGSLCSSVWPTH